MSNRTKNALWAGLSAFCLMLTMLAPCLTVRATADWVYTLHGTAGATLTAPTTVTDVTITPTELATAAYTGNTVTVNAASGAVGLAAVTVTCADESTKTFEVPCGYTVFDFNGDSLTVFEGNCGKYEILGVDAAANEYSVDAEDAAYLLPVTENADGSKTYQNTDDYLLDVEIKKAGGTFVLTGSTEDMSVAVKKEATGDATLLLAGLSMTSTRTAPITVKKNSTAKVYIQALAGTENTLTDAEKNNADLYGDPTEDGGDGSNTAFCESAVIKGSTAADITLAGSGTLNLVCNSKNAVKTGTSGALTVDGITLNIQSTKHGISCDNTFTMLSGALNITAAEDGIRTNPDAVDATTGCAAQITLAGGSVTVHSGADCIQSMQDITVTGGTLNLTAGSGYLDSTFNKDTMSCKGLKAAPADGTEDPTNIIAVSGGTITVNTPDDAIHSDAYVQITGGVLNLSGGDDGIHADTTLTVGAEDALNGAIRLTVQNSYEGLEAGTVNVYSGIILLNAEDDGINAAGGSDGSGGEPGGGGFRPGGFNPFKPGGSGGGSTSTGDYSLNISGGRVTVYAGGDGLDSNGTLTLSGGNIIVMGPKSGTSNAGLDSDGTLLVKGATVFVAGSAAMVENPASGSQVYLGSRTSVTQGKTINVYYNGTRIFNIAADKAYNYLFYSAPDMTSTTGWSFTVNTDAVAETVLSCDDLGHTWNSGTVTTPAGCTTDGVKTYTCTVCTATKTEVIPAGHTFVNGYCSACGAEDPDADWHTAVFTLTHCTVTVYPTQDITAAGEENPAVAYARNSDTGLKDLTGDGQLNFVVTPESGYTLQDITVAGSYKNLKTVDAAAGVYRITKIQSDLTVTVTAVRADLTGDTNGDGSVDVRDLVHYKKLLANGGELDLNLDGKTDSADITYLFRILLGLELTA